MARLGTPAFGCLADHPFAIGKRRSRTPAPLEIDVIGDRQLAIPRSGAAAAWVDEDIAVGEGWCGVRSGAGRVTTITGWSAPHLWVGSWPTRSNTASGIDCSSEWAAVTRSSCAVLVDATVGSTGWANALATVDR
jgi:hypothetical protein